MTRGVGSDGKGVSMPLLRCCPGRPDAPISCPNLFCGVLGAGLDADDREDEVVEVIDETGGEVGRYCTCEGAEVGDKGGEANGDSPPSAS